MKNIFKKINIWNFKRIPYFFEKNHIDTNQHHYALIGKLSTSLLHDVLSPLTSLLLTSELAEGQTKNLKPFILNSSSHLKDYVEVMRSFLSEQSSNTSIHINEEIRKSILLLKHKAIQSNVQIQFLEFDQIYSKINPLHIYQIIINLLTNAIEASTESEIKKIILVLKRSKKEITVECKDFGNGIPNEYIKKIGLYRFSTKSKSRGLGLYSITHIVTNILQGTLTIESTPKEGSLFTCCFPIRK